MTCSTWEIPRYSIVGSHPWPREGGGWVGWVVGSLLRGDRKVTSKWWWWAGLARLAGFGRRSRSQGNAGNGKHPGPVPQCGLITLSYSEREGRCCEDPALRPGVEPCFARVLRLMGPGLYFFYADPPHPASAMLLSTLYNGTYGTTHTLSHARRDARGPPARCVLGGRT